MTTTVGASTSYQLTVPALSETADIQVALKLLAYGQSADPTDNADIETNSLIGHLLTGLSTKSNIASPTFTGTVYAPTISAAASANTALNIFTGNQSSSAGSISITAGNSTSTGAGGNINLTAGNSSSSNPGNIYINAGGGTATGGIYLGNAMGSSQPIYLGSSTSTVDVYGTLRVGGGYGSTGVTVSAAGAITADASITSASAVLFAGKSGTPTSQDTGYYLSSNGSILASRSNGTPLYSHVYGGTSGDTGLQFILNGTTQGKITINSGANPAFATGSDYRMKTEITPILNALERMKNAKAYTFYKIDEIDPTHTLQTGFIAHELAEVQPDAVLGEKDAVDENGNPVYQEVMEAKIIPVMAQAINDLIGLVEKLTSRIEQLENK